MTAPRVACPGRILPRDRHYATATRWTITTSAGSALTSQSTAHAALQVTIVWPADVEAGRGDATTRAGEAAA